MKGTISVQKYYFWQHCLPAYQIKYLLLLRISMRLIRWDRHQQPTKWAMALNGEIKSRIIFVVMISQ